MKTIISTEDLRIFLWVARLSSFTRAAEQLQLPRTSISNAIQRLEERLGARLLQRTTRRVQITREGEELLERCERLLDDLDDIGALFQHGSQLQGRIRADMPLGLATGLVLPRLPEFLQRHPALQIDIFSTDRRVDLLAEGFDLVVRAGAVVDESLVSRPLLMLELLNVASPAYIAQHGLPATLDDLPRHWLVNYQPNPASQPASFEYVDAASGTSVYLPMRHKVTVNNSVAYNAAAHAGLGIAQIPAARARADIAAGLLVQVLPQHPPLPMATRILFPHRRNIPQRVRAFADWIADIAGDGA
ncbi:DNA-binding transcriptional LysR family regulator [Duganella sp. 1224]|uniref:LysR family transcriptional regulator n=1 Tax=Duganella sp. 1224 TaxID=2587052 RepID=UPI00183A8308|nr:LysR family transcriptional regulator [Duganella sp. 1224]NYE60491.1 DNA-binding transcriptional LysR family regulator [Duganella sp. 1224]